MEHNTREHINAQNLNWRHPLTLKTTSSSVFTPVARSLPTRFGNSRCVNLHTLCVLEGVRSEILEVLQWLTMRSAYVRPLRRLV